MAYRRSGGRSGRRGYSRSRARSPGRVYRPARSRPARRAGRTGGRSGYQTLRIVLEQPGVSPVARPELLGLKPAPAARKGRF